LSLIVLLRRASNYRSRLIVNSAVLSRKAAKQHRAFPFVEQPVNGRRVSPPPSDFQGFVVIPCNCRSGLSGARGINSKLMSCAWPKGSFCLSHLCRQDGTCCCDVGAGNQPGQVLWHLPFAWFTTSSGDTTCPPSFPFTSLACAGLWRARWPRNVSSLPSAGDLSIRRAATSTSESGQKRRLRAEPSRSGHTQ
jgi:hypothetical protein